LYLHYWRPPSTPDVDPGSYCVDPGVLPQIPVPSYDRGAPKISPEIPKATTLPNSLIRIDNTTPPNVRTRRISPDNGVTVIPTNKWYTPILVGQDSGWIPQYPYLLQVDSGGVSVSWTRTLEDGQFIRNWEQVNPIRISAANGIVQALDVLDWDSEGIVIQYTIYNQASGETGFLRYPLIRGCPYISLHTDNCGLSVSFDGEASLYGPSSVANWYKWSLRFPGGSDYNLYLSRFVTPRINGSSLTIPSFTGWVRLAYIDPSVDQSLLDQHVFLIPERTTITSTDTGYRLYYATSDGNVETLMTVASPLGTHDGMLPYRYRVGPVDVVLDLSVPKFMPSTNPNIVQILRTEIPIISNLAPSTFSDWCRWIGSLAMLLNIAASSGLSGQEYTNLLNLMQDKLFNPPDTLYLDQSWGGIIPNIGMSSCTGIASVYTGTLHDYGYIMFAWDTLIRLSPSVDISGISPGPRDILDHVMETLVREKDWWIGWDQTQGLRSSSQSGGVTLNGQVTYPQTSAFAYWAAYRLSQSLAAPSDTQLWTLRAFGSSRWFLDTWVYAASWNPLMSISYFNNTGYGLDRLGGDPSFPNRYAALMVPLTKPLSPVIGPDQISSTWLNSVTDYVPIDDTLTPESLLTSLYLHQSTITADDVVQLPYGSTWSSAAYLLSL
jgi:hypothetical protein